jgi:hypothetical protein
MSAHDPVPRSHCFLVPGAARGGNAVTALHFLVRSPPARAPLPTLRFLSPRRARPCGSGADPRDVALLALRVLFALCSPPRSPARCGRTGGV